MKAMRKKLDRLADEDLIARVTRGDTRAFEVVFDRHSRAAYSLAFRVTGDATTANDVVQESFLSLWRTSGSYRPERGSLRAWLLSVVHNRAVDQVRRSLVHDRRRAQFDGVEERREAPGRTDTEAIRRGEAESVRAVLGRLPADQLRVIELAYYGGFTQSQIAEMLEMPIGTVKSRMRLGLDKMRDGLEALVA